MKNIYDLTGPRSREWLDREYGRDGLSFTPDPGQIFEVKSIDPQEGPREMRHLVLATSLEEASRTARNHLWRVCGNSVVIISVTATNDFVAAVSEDLYDEACAYRTTFL